MENSFEEIKKRAEQEIKKYQQIINKWQQISAAATLEDIVEVDSTATTNGSADNIKSVLSKSLNTAPTLTDYKPDWNLEDKVRYFAAKINRAFSSKEFKKFFEDVEGSERAEELLKGPLLHQRFNYLRKSSKFIGAGKFGNSNLHTYYVLKDWLTEDKLDFRPEHYPSKESFGNLAEDKRCKAHLKIL